ncbi:hypothetical protein F5Y11DRAFT_332197 [Daldinia sp. FL1419]|nr:hypothetical protein F5Y11DRAFT_332197 [Daldinia sp. FL1419]
MDYSKVNILMSLNAHTVKTKRSNSVFGLSLHNGRVPRSMGSQLQHNVDGIQLCVKPRPKNINIIKVLKYVLKSLEGSTRRLRSRNRLCATELSSPCSLYLNTVGPKTIGRIKLNSTIPFTIDWQTYRNLEEILHATTSAIEAAEAWNKGNVGVQFQLITSNDPVMFRITYSGACQVDPRRFAEAFFPGDSQRKRQLHVYAPCFDKKAGYFDYMANILYHEFGHILGLRHEFANKESGSAPVLFGNRNPLSVMNYFNHPREIRIQPDDYNFTKLFYGLRGINGYKFYEEDPKALEYVL